MKKLTRKFCPILFRFYQNQKMPFNHRQTVHPNGTLEISSVTQSDAGMYECRAESGRSQTPSDIQTMPGQAASARMSISVAYAPEISPVSLGENTSGQRFSTTCVATVGDSPISIHWFKDNKLISEINNLNV